MSLPLATIQREVNYSKYLSRLHTILVAEAAMGIERIPAYITDLHFTFIMPEVHGKTIGRTSLHEQIEHYQYLFEVNGQ